ncbi:MAG TPA: SRPBCC family protein [Acidimicrobiia bacterium]|nr:SRPBCC family protein [Acidimicrobiia bacterium]
MREFVSRTFVVDVPLRTAWDHLARVEDWPAWAKHIKRVKLSPSGALTADSAGAFVLSGGVRSTFRMEAFDPPRRWQWVGPLMTARLHYDHQFEAVDDAHTRLTWTVTADGPLAALVTRIASPIYARNLDRAIPNLQRELVRTSND